ncbi:hypothetical protein D3C71_1388980 [compost metagenome]
MTIHVVLLRARLDGDLDTILSDRQFNLQRQLAILIQHAGWHLPSNAVVLQSTAGDLSPLRQSLDGQLGKALATVCVYQVSIYLQGCKVGNLAQLATLKLVLAILQIEGFDTVEVMVGHRPSDRVCIDKPVVAAVGQTGRDQFQRLHRAGHVGNILAVTTVIGSGCLQALRDERVVAPIPLQLDRGRCILATDQNVISVTANQVLIDAGPTDQGVVVSPTDSLEACTAAELDRVVASPAIYPAAIAGNQIIIPTRRVR